MGLQFLEYDPKNSHVQLLESIQELILKVEEERHEISASNNW